MKRRIILTPAEEALREQMRTGPRDEQIRVLQAQVTALRKALELLRADARFGPRRSSDEWMLAVCDRALAAVAGKGGDHE